MFILVILVILGAVSGVAAKVVDQAEARWISELGNYPGAWIMALALVAWLAPSPLHAAARSALFFVVTVLAYYGWSTWMLGIEGGRYVAVWTAVALTFVPAAAVSLHYGLTRKGALAGMVVALAAGAVLGDGAIRQLWLRYALDALPPEFPLHPVQAAVNVVVAVVIIGMLPRHRETSLWALALVLPMAWVAVLVVERAYGTLLG